MPIFNMHEAKSQLSKLVGRVCHGEEVIIARDGKPVARLMPIEARERKKRPFGLDKGKVWMSEDFNDPLPDEFTGISD